MGKPKPKINKTKRKNHLKMMRTKANAARLSRKSAINYDKELVRFKRLSDDLVIVNLESLLGNKISLETKTLSWKQVLIWKHECKLGNKLINLEKRVLT